MDQPTQQMPPPAPDTPRRWRRAPLLAAVFGALLLAGVLAATAIAAAVSANRPAQASEGLDTLFEPVVAQDQSMAEGGPFAEGGGPFAGGHPDQPGERPGWHGRRLPGPLHLAEGEKVLAGSVSSVGEGMLTVRKDSGPEVAVPTDGDTKVRGNGNRALSDLQPGERVVVKAGADGKADAVLVVRAHVAGTVTELEGDRATVVSPGGLTRELDLSEVPQRPAAGTVVIAVGTATDGGATLKVQELRELPTLG